MRDGQCFQRILNQICTAFDAVFFDTFFKDFSSTTRIRCFQPRLNLEHVDSELWCVEQILL